VVESGEQVRCLNCGAALAGDYCHRCGQPARVHRTAGAVWHDIAHGVLHFEGKIWRTLPMLFLRPGALTRRYIAGERARFVSPLVVFLFSVFLMFGAFNLAGRQAYEAADPAQRTAPGQTQAAEDSGPVDLDLKGAPGPLGWFGDAFERANGNPKLLAYKLQSNAYKFSWVMIPLSVPFLWLLLLHRRRYRRYGLYEHTVFVTYALSFLSLFAIAYTGLKLFGMTGTVALLPFVIPIAHTFVHLKGAYDLRPFSAGWRTAALFGLAFIAAALYFLLLLALGVLG
jgi:hypothetical protein